MVQVIYGANEIHLPVERYSVSLVLNSVQQILNFSSDCIAFLNGNRIEDPTASLQNGDRLELIKERGRKGGAEQEQKTPVEKVYFGSNSGATKALLAKISRAGQRGKIAAELFRVQKASTRAKRYRGGIRRSDGSYDAYRSLAYEKKGECIKRLCDLLQVDSVGLTWGWGRDSMNLQAPNVLYVDLPQGQVSFHSTDRYLGHDYESEWDGSYASQRRIIDFCDAVYAKALNVNSKKREDKE